MINSVYIVGYNGNMARRYRACLDYLKIRHYGHDIDFQRGSVLSCDGIIIATPTANHFDDLIDSLHTGLPILCEKPIHAEESFILPDKNIQMINQYAFCGPFPGGDTYYNNWNSGKDGLAWDCINIIGLAEGSVAVGGASPIWKCMINGKELSLADVDKSYVKMIDAWTKNPTPNIDYIYKAHEKVREYIETSSNWNTGKIH